MDFRSQNRVLVAGAGIAGLALTRALHRRGVPVLALERRDGPSDAGLAINLPGNAIRALTRLGLGDALSTCGVPVRRREYRTEQDRVLFAVDEDEFWGPDARPRCVRRSTLLGLLELGTPASAVRRDCEVTLVQLRPNGVDVGLADGSIEMGGLLVGADGVRSRVRATMGGKAPAAAQLASASWRFMAPNPGVDCWTLWAGARSMILLIPVDRGEVYGWAAATKGQTGLDDANALNDLFRGFPERVRRTIETVLARPGSLHHSPLEEVRIPSWSRDRVILMGDAAHATAPVWAQGAALALEDAVVLADLLADRTDWEEIGPEYEQRRRPRVAHVQAMTDRMSRTAHLPIVMRNALMQFVGPRSYRATYAPLRTPQA
ncbi:NAD(P)/FAD-dependent oxidoreductase [Caulobacter sp. S45]|uniref:FAD-dependent oxidoreductase n=1 Tax=Caulobacter sp. S45 TaxID=1641861 RepID=UPI00131AACF9|nr:NAD(P)/FAD-dependent oxidoreductase [Caulobacter sp. S45]